MSKIDDAAEEVLRFEEKFRGLIKVAEVIRDIGSLDQAIAERTAARDQVVQEHEAAKINLTATRAALEILRQTIADERTQHQTACAALSEKASREAAAIVNQAHNDANALKAKTTEELNADRRDHDRQISGSLADLAAIERKIDEAHATLAAVTATHEATLQRVDALKAAAKSVLGDA